MKPVPGRIPLVSDCLRPAAASSQEQKADQRLRKEAQVTLYRSYRVGDFPDIQIPFSNLIAPLQALAQVRLLLAGGGPIQRFALNGFRDLSHVVRAHELTCFPRSFQRDPLLAKQLFSSLFSAILQEMDANKPRQKSAEIKEELRCTMNQFLSKSSLCFPPFIACVQVGLQRLCLHVFLMHRTHVQSSAFVLMSTRCVCQEMCYQQKELLQIDPAAISSTSLVSLQQPSGILLLEDGLLLGSGQDEPAAKRPRGRKEIPPDTKKWIHLAK